MSAYNMNAGSPCFFRTYPATSNAIADCKIWEALRATMAHPSLFKSIEIGELGLRERFVDGALGCGNPTSHLLDEAKRVFRGRRITSIVSIGAGHAHIVQIPQCSGLERALRIDSPVARALKAAQGMAADNERVADEVAKRFVETKELYYRLNVNQGLQGIEASKWERLDEVATHTRVYMQQVESSRTIDGTVDAICKRDAVLDTVHIGGALLAQYIIIN
jgi:predicted acylesterase/phospholipase RssA